MSDITTVRQKGNRIEVCQGTELKMNIHLEPIDGYTMDAYNFSCVAYCSVSKKIIAKKSDCKRIDSSNYMMIVDTNLLSTGDLNILVLADIPDSDMSDMIRTEPIVIDTQIRIIKAPFDLKEVKEYGLS